MQSRKYLLSAAMLAGLVMGSTGCEVISSVDRSQIGNTGGSGGMGGSGGSGGSMMCVPEDDQNECTDDVCNADNTTAHNPKAAGEPCTTGGSQCDGNGQCVECIVATDCPGMDDACQTRTCTAGVCGMDFTAADTPTPTQTAGDCKIEVCDGSGLAIQNNDDTDVPDDSEACTTDTCDMGTPSHTNVAQGSDCTPPGGPDPLVCNDMGQCVGCNVAADCPGTDDECSTRTCDMGVCGVSFTAKDTPVAAQTPNDCLVHVCDGAGNFVDIADDADVPLDDGNACTTEACAGGMPMHPNAADGALCSDGDGCTQTDTCQMGVCTGANPVVCAASDQCHDAGMCDPMTGMCSDPAKMDGTACDDSDACTQADTCQAGACTGADPIVCMASDQCHDVGTCDPMTGMCSDPAKMDGSMCDDSDACTQTDACQAGVCTGANPVVCMASDQCHDVGSCDPGTGTCSDPVKMDGSMCDDSDACTQADSCQAGVCTGANPVVCMASDQCHVAGTCDPMTGTCDDPNAPDGTMCTLGGSGGVCSVGVCSLCGNGSLDAGEQCDDSNTTGGDGCSSMCQIEEIEPNAMCAEATAIALSGSPLSGSVVGAITPLGDHDWYSFTLPAGPPRSVRIETFVGGSGMCTEPNGTADTEIFFYASDCTTELGSDDQDGIGNCSLIDPAVDNFAQNLAPNTYYVQTIRWLDNAVIDQYQLVVTVVGECSNGVVEPGEACDDGDLMGGDGCSATCTVEPGYTCSGSPSVCAPPEILCNDGMDNNGDGSIDAADPSCAVPAYFTPCGGGESMLVYQVPVGTDIPEDPTVLDSSVNVAAGGNIARTAIAFDITHEYAADVDVYLTPPGGAPLDASTGNGSFGVDFTDTLLDSTCAVPIDTATDADAPFSACYSPETSFATLNGTPANGLWTFTVTDNYAFADYGTLNNWRLILCTTP
ncbi:MAG: proprotein convertase P-domain-containing protein [Polyangiaceae bacterium]|nr:proprotein convertase P-domain-containing protein [Polyangiaceae bacterium]